MSNESKKEALQGELVKVRARINELKKNYAILHRGGGSAANALDVFSSQVATAQAIRIFEEKEKEILSEISKL